MDVALPSEAKRAPKAEMVCRFCLTQDDLSSISGDDYLQIMICPTLAQYDDDDIPDYICDDCRRLLEHSFNFHRMCKKANKLLAKYHFTGILPQPLEKPCLPPKQQQHTTADKSVNTEATGVTSTASQTDEEFENVEFAVCNAIDEEIDAPKTEILDEMSLDEEACQEVTNEAMFSETSVMYESGGPDESLIFEDNDESSEPNNEISNQEDSAPFDCNFCELTFPLRQLRDIHMNEHDRVRKYHCDKCNKKFYTKKDLHQHGTVHTGEKPFKCSLCHKGYTRKFSLDRHESRHAEVLKYLCIYCDKSLPSRLVLEDHMKIHESAPKFTCNICYKSFGFRKNLVRHSALHQHLFPCEYCQEGFGTQKKLTAHLLTHSDANSTVLYYCEQCEQTFNSAKKYKNHMQLHSTKSEKSLNCFYCNSNFKNREDYVKHTAVHSKENLICTLCLTQFQNVQDIDAEVDEHIKLHIKGEVFSCEFCNFLCLTETELSLHTC